MTNSNNNSTVVSSYVSAILDMNDDISVNADLVNFTLEETMFFEGVLMPSDSDLLEDDFMWEGMSQDEANFAAGNVIAFDNI